MAEFSVLCLHFHITSLMEKSSVRQTQCLYDIIDIEVVESSVMEWYHILLPARCTWPRLLLQELLTGLGVHAKVGIACKGRCHRRPLATEVLFDEVLSCMIIPRPTAVVEAAMSTAQIGEVRPTVHTAFFRLSVSRDFMKSISSFWSSITFFMNLTSDGFVWR
jgi:hypothetical protein